jgi:hypothetical protein
VVYLIIHLLWSLLSNSLALILSHLSFFKILADHKFFMDRIEEGWNIVVSGYSMFQLYTRLKSVKGILKIQNSEVFGGFGHRVLKARQDLASAQAGFIDSHGVLDWQKKERESLHAYISIAAAEENFLK